ncbi:alpha-N-arabinofuranosidase [Limisphaera ngatamarikiensis]|uniref:non-reducing end alpha-L-arabinofuranosidase n=1 Tax=Limisphaera ngatamarikiensis TaxID=1324935 RepID=A0A6M1RH34_9BACT|nr:alpha-L-arabinofuranosidase C-terminal domain-containing protein [Limisphaera ngatamarikiensis]NGO39378.1 alpha-N-arabinofuranosidase [Limisphaera ngatamarikiensis]
MKPRLRLILALGALLGMVGLLPAQNLVRNESFENAQGNRPRGWRTETWGGQADFSYPQPGRTGERSVGIASQAGADAAWATTVTVDPFARYRLSGWIKTEAVEPVQGGRGALLNIHGLEGAATPAVTGTRDWTRVEVEFDVDDQTQLQINCLFGGWGRARGRAWFDDIALEKLEQRQPPAPKIEVDASRIGEPLSPLVYGQFIEHLGRCIYGGIWAEMLEDRKFYYPITSNYAPYTALRNTQYPVVGASPWQIVGRPDGVEMTTNAPFVGRHTPLLRQGTGIRQNDLGVTAGKEYVGYAWLKHPENRSARARVTLRWGQAAADAQTVEIRVRRGDYQKYPFRFTAGLTTDQASLEIRAEEGDLLVGTISLMPADNIHGMRADTLALLRQLAAPIYRWPGGNFVSGYDWRDGIGDRDRRPPRTNPAWTGVEHNDFGLHEFIDFCRLVGAQPLVTVNTGFGDAHSAAALVEYCNGPADSHWGRQRARNGSPQPFGIRYWCVGNEMWGPWQLGYMSLDHYVLKQNWVVDKMREVDPTIFCIASGNAGPWSRGLLERCSDHMEAIAEHFYCQERSGLAAHVRQIPDNIRAKADFHRRMRSELPQLKGRDIRIAMTEWNYWYGPHVFGELGTRYFLKDALGIAAGLHEYARQSDLIHSAFYAQTVNVIGAIKTSRRNAAFETTGLVLMLYRHQFGELPVHTRTEGLIDAQAAWSLDRRRLTLGIVNPTLQAQVIPLQIHGAALKKRGMRWQIAGTDPQLFNDPDEPLRVRIEQLPFDGSTDRIEVAPCSVTLVAWEAD